MPYYHHLPSSYINPYLKGQYPKGPQSGPSYFPSPFEQYAKPKQPTDWQAFMQPMNNISYPPPPPQQNGLLSYFQDKNGQVDLDKMFTTVGKFANTVQQVTPIVKQFGSFMKSMK